MRLIGHLAEKTGAQTFSDFLCVEGIPNEVEADQEGWAVWVHAEEDVGKAKDLLSEFRSNPSAQKYQNRSVEAEQIKHREQLDEAKARNRYFDRARLFQQVRPYRLGPLTVMLVAVCIGVTLYSRFGKNHAFLEPLWITPFTFEGAYIKWVPGLTEIKHGEIWRLITPIFIHLNLPHLIFNVLAMLDLGSMIESRQSSGRLALLVLFLAIISNLAQYSLDWPRLNAGNPAFGGISGVAYGLIGYIWMKSKFDPASGFYLHPQTVLIMLIFFVLCFTPVLPGIANGAHAAGLVVGVGWGFVSAKWANRK